MCIFGHIIQMTFVSDSVACAHTHTPKQTHIWRFDEICLCECEFLFRINLSLDSLPAPTNQHTHTHTLTHICTCFRHVDTIECACVCVMCVRRWWVMCVCVSRMMVWDDACYTLIHDSHTMTPTRFGWLAAGWRLRSHFCCCVRDGSCKHEHGFCVCVRVFCVNKWSIFF